MAPLGSRWHSVTVQTTSRGNNDPRPGAPAESNGPPHKRVFGERLSVHGSNCGWSFIGQAGRFISQPSPRHNLSSPPRRGGIVSEPNSRLLPAFAPPSAMRRGGGLIFWPDLEGCYCQSARHRGGCARDESL